MNASVSEPPSLTGTDLAAFGIDLIAYVKPVEVDGLRRFSIHAADGTPLTVVAGRDIAFATVRRHELEPVSVH